MWVQTEFVGGGIIPQNRSNWFRDLGFVVVVVFIPLKQMREVIKLPRLKHMERTQRVLWLCNLRSLKKRKQRYRESVTAEQEKHSGLVSGPVALAELFIVIPRACLFCTFKR